jgi:DNA invertase Pin-like site-specific DNA recombinase
VPKKSTKSNTPKGLGVPQVAIYARISDDREGKEAGVKNQEKACRAFVQEKGWQVKEVYIDNDISASQSKKKREDYERLLIDLKAGVIDTIVVWAVDRLYRQPIQLEELLKILEKSPSIKIFALQGSILDLSTIDGRANARILVTLAKRETDLLKERIRFKHKELAEKGLSHGGLRAFGYKEDQIHADPKEAKIIREMYKMFLATENLSEIIRWLNNKRKIKTARGGTWSRKTVSTILSNKRYIGIRVHKDNEYPAVWEKIVDEKTFKAVQKILSDPDRKTVPKVTRRYLLTGLVYCGNCGHKMSNMTRGKALGSTSSYACRNDPAIRMRGCGGVRMVGAWVDTFVTKAALTYLSREKELLKDLAGNNNEQQLRRHTELLEELEASRNRMNVIQDMFLDGKTTQSEYERARKKLGTKHELLEKEIDLLEASRSPKVIFEGEDIDAIWEKRSIEERRAILKVIIQEVKIHKSKNHGSNLPQWDRIEIIWRK